MLAAALGCSSVEDPSASTDEATASVEEALRDGKDKDEKEMKRRKDDCVRDAKFDLRFWGKSEKDAKSFRDFVRDEKEDAKKTKELFRELYDDQKGEFLGNSKKAERVFKDLFEHSKGKFLDENDREKKVFDVTKVVHFDFDFGKKDVEKKVVYAPNMDGAGTMLWWGGAPSWRDVLVPDDETNDDDDGDDD